jgi:hypothetical protein
MPSESKVVVTRSAIPNVPSGKGEIDLKKYADVWGKLPAKERADA